MQKYYVFLHLTMNLCGIVSPWQKYKYCSPDKHQFPNEEMMPVCENSAARKKILLP